MATILIPTTLRKFTGGVEVVNTDGPTIAKALATLGERFPELKAKVFDEHGQLQRFVNLYLNDEDVRYLSGNATAVAPGDVIAIIPAIAGG